MKEQIWEVVGGTGSGGILVREGQDIKSAQLSERLSTGSLIKELEFSQDRVCYELLTGCGPHRGWVSVSLKGKALLVKLDGSSRVEPTQNFSDCLPPQEIRQLFGRLANPYAIEEISIPQGANLRIITISDIHMDYPINKTWFGKHLPSERGSTLSSLMRDYNVLILPGDISDRLDRIVETLEMFVKCFDLVCFTPGNHDLWIRAKDGPADSMEKFRQIIDTCDEMKVCTRPVRLRSEGRSDVVIVPLLSWYSDQWDREPDLPWYPSEDGFHGWMDYRTIKWPDVLINEVIQREGKFRFSSEEGTSPAIGDVFSAMNEPWLRELSNAAHDTLIISFSHYLPRQELFPPKRFLVNPNLHKVSGSIQLESQIRRLQPAVHVFGHTHLTMDLVVDGQRYVQWALGNPSEQQAMTLAVAQTGMLVLYDSAGEPHIPPVQTTFWGRFLQSHPRDVTETCPSPFVRKRFAERGIEVPLSDEYYLTTPNPGPAIMDYDGLFENRWRQ